MVSLQYISKRPPGSSRFHSGAWTAELWGVWQNTHTRDSVAARTVPGPLTERLWTVSRTRLLPVDQHRHPSADDEPDSLPDHRGDLL